MDNILHREEAMTELETVQNRADFEKWWNKAVIALQALRLIVKNPIWKIAIKAVIDIGNAIYNTK